MADRIPAVEVRRLYHLLLRKAAEQGEDATSGSFPDISDMHGGGDTASFGVLVDLGLIEHDVETGLVRAIFPLVAQAPSIDVLLDADDRFRRQAAGVVDGFALASLLGRQVSVRDACLTCGASVQVLMDADGLRRREPRSSVVVRVPTEDSRQGRYDAARLACSPEHAQAALDAFGNADAVMTSIEGLFIEARDRYTAVLP